MSGRVTAAAAAAVAALCTVGAAHAPSRSDLLVVRFDPSPAAPGGITTLHGFVTNARPDQAASAFTVLVALPTGFTAEGPYFPAGCHAEAAGHLVSCAFPAGLPPLRSATALIPVRVATEVRPGTVARGRVNVFSTRDGTPAADRTTFNLTVTG